MAVLVVWFFLALLGCGDRDVPGIDTGGARADNTGARTVSQGAAGPPPPGGAVSHAEPAPDAAGPPVTPTIASAPGDPHRGRELAARFQCGRCHDGDGVEPAPFLEHCVHC